MSSAVSNQSPSQVRSCCSTHQFSEEKTEKQQLPFLTCFKLEEDSRQQMPEAEEFVIPPARGAGHRSGKAAASA